MTDGYGTRPNILLVMTDSSRTDTVSDYGSPFAVSPNLDRLAAEGVRFTQAHTQAPVCMPARVSLLTGTHTPVHGVVENGISRRGDLVTLPDLLARAGYHNLLVGKAHLGGPVPDSFHEQHVLTGEKDADVDDEYARHLAAHGRPRASGGPGALPGELSCDAFLVDQTIAALRRHREQDPEQPFFAFCSLPSPHSPLDPPAPWASLFDSRPLPPLNLVPGEEERWPAHLRALVGSRGVEAATAERADGTLDLVEVGRQRRLYHGLAAWCDAQVGRLLAFLDEAGLRDSTLVVFTTDHGQQYYDHGFNDKHTFYDESWRIPLILRWPGVVPPGGQGGWAMTSDLAVTFAAAAGVEAPTLQGFDLVGSLLDPDRDGRRCAVAVLHRSLALATRRWKLEYFPEDGTGRLFDRIADPSEQQDHWEDEECAAVRRLLLEALLTWRADLTDVQHLHEHTSAGGPVARRVSAQSMSRTGRDAEERLGRRAAAIDQLTVPPGNDDEEIMSETTTPAVPRAEHPRPQWRRERWTTLNGRWDFEIDRADSGLERGLLEQPYARQILVPFAPESACSGIEDTDFMDAVWYRRQVDVDPAWLAGRLLLHFQAVDHDTTVWVNGAEVGRHRGGSTPFAFDIAPALAGTTRASIVVRARDPRGPVQARGKQATQPGNSGCFYTRTTGIWQSVWLEPVATSHLERPRITPDVANGAFHVVVGVHGWRRGLRLDVQLTDDAGSVTRRGVQIGHDFSGRVVLDVPEDRRRLWSPSDPHLYGLRFELRSREGDLIDEAHSYAGLRSVAVEGNAVLINGSRVFQRLVLDQGYWPDGIMTAPSDEALVRDIELGQAAGFNGARLHQKVFEERYLYHADRLGYLVWGEFPDWGAAGQGPVEDHQRPTTAFVAEWLDVLERDHNHPAVIGWCPLNETRQVLHDRETQLDDVTRAMFRAAKTMDPTRPVLDASGYSHRVPDTDVWDSHSYEQDPEAFAREHAGLADGRPFGNTEPDGRPRSLPYRGQPYMVSEYGGIWWNPDEVAASGTDREASWGYGQRVSSIEELYARFEGLTRVLIEDPDMFGYCYTQLTDVFQEQNGIYRFDRSLKFPLDRVRRAQTVRAAYERVEDD